jgi:hypothetical protein
MSRQLLYVKFLTCAGVSAALLFVQACGQGKGGQSGIGCSKTSSILKAPVIRTD